jgi:hypothetical protein
MKLFGHSPMAWNCGLDHDRHRGLVCGRASWTMFVRRSLTRPGTARQVSGSARATARVVRMLHQSSVLLFVPRTRPGQPAASYRHPLMPW